MRATCAAAVALLSLAGMATGLMMSVDMGSKYMKVALLQPGRPFEIAHNLNSKRKTSQITSFYDGERLFENDAENIYSRKPSQTIWSPHVLMGINASQPQAKKVLERGSAVQISSNDRGALQFSLKDGAKEISLDAEQATAMLLSHAREFSEVISATPIKDAVFTVPSFFTDAQRSAIFDAADLAGIRVLGLVEENTGSAIQYGIDNVFDEPQLVVIYDMGYESTQVTLFAFSSYTKRGRDKPIGQIDVLAKAWDTTLGGRAFDDVLVEYFLGEFTKQHKQDLRSKPRAMAKLRKSCEKVKEILSANEEFPLTIESLTGDIDFRARITRTKFLELAAPLLARVTAPLQSVLDQADIKVQDLHDTELVGGSIRIPQVQTVLSEFMEGYVATAQQPSPSQSWS